MTNVDENDSTIQEVQQSRLLGILTSLNEMELEMRVKTEVFRSRDGCQSRNRSRRSHLFVSWVPLLEDYLYMKANGVPSVTAFFLTNPAMRHVLLPHVADSQRDILLLSQNRSPR